MFELLKRLKMQMTLSAVLTILLGVILAAMPGMAVETLFLILGWILVITGIAALISSLFTKGKPMGQGDLVLGLLELATGLVVLAKPNLLASVLGIVLGLVMVMHGAKDIQNAREAKALGYDWKLSLAVGILTLVMGVLVILNPFSTAKMLLRVAGICLIVDGVGDLLLVQRGPKN